MDNKGENPPAYGGAPMQAPQPTWQGGAPDGPPMPPPGQQGYSAGPTNMDYYQQQPQQGYPPQGQYPPQGYPQQGYPQQGYPPQQGQYPPQGQYQQEDRGGSDGCLKGLVAALACCCCLDCLF